MGYYFNLYINWTDQLPSLVYINNPWLGNKPTFQAKKSNTITWYHSINWKVYVLNASINGNPPNPKAFRILSAWLINYLDRKEPIIWHNPLNTVNNLVFLYNLKYRLFVFALVELQSSLILRLCQHWLQYANAGFRCLFFGKKCSSYV